MTIDTGAVSFTVKEWAYDASGNEIKAGQASTTGVNTVTTGSPLSIYPNPACNKIQLKMSVDENMQLSIADINMNTVSSVVIKKGQHDPTIDISTLAKGIYCIMAQKGGDVYTSMFVKQ